MLETVSPYALLRASIPHPTSTPPTAYDLFSLSQSVPQSAPARQAVPIRQAESAAQTEPAAQDEPIPQNVPARQSAPISPRIPAKRTHYISDIHSRHSAAVRSATFVTPQR